MICKNCGFENLDGAKFCSGCGQALETENTPQNNVPQSNGQYGNAPYNNPPQNNGQYGNVPYNNPPQNNGQYGNAPYNNPQQNGQYGNAPYGNMPQGNFRPQNGMPPYNNYPVQKPKKKNTLLIVLIIVVAVVVIGVGGFLAFNLLSDDSSNGSTSNSSTKSVVTVGNTIDDCFGYLNDGLNGNVDSLKKCVPSFMGSEFDEQAKNIENSFAIYKDKATINFEKLSEKDVTNEKSTKDSTLNWKDYIQKDFENTTGYDGGKVQEVSQVNAKMEINITDKTLKDSLNGQELSQTGDIIFCKYNNNWYIYDMS